MAVFRALAAIGIAAGSFSYAGAANARHVPVASVRAVAPAMAQPAGDAARAAGGGARNPMVEPALHPVPRKSDGPEPDRVNPLKRRLMAMPSPGAAPGDYGF